MVQEEWKIIPECPTYEVSTLGRIFSKRFERFLVCSLTKDHNVKVNLVNKDGVKVTRSVAKLVAEAFVDPPTIPHTSKRHQCDHVVILDGDFTNLSADNLVWRPRWIAWQYRQQLTYPQRAEFHDFRILNTRTGREYNSIIEAGMTEGLLFIEIWRSTFRHNAIFPYWDQFEIVGRN